MAETEGRLQPELVFVYARPPGSDPASKGAAKVYDALKRDLTGKRRCLRLDWPAGSAEAAVVAGPLGLDELERQLREAIRSSFEMRAAAYEEEVRRLMLARLDPAWSFSSLYLVKDSLAVMLEAGGLLDDALREYAELEACYSEAVQVRARVCAARRDTGRAPHTPARTPAAVTAAACRQASWRGLGLASRRPPRTRQR